VCGAAARVVRGNHPFAECGLRRVVLQGVEIVRCAKCGNEEVTIPRLNELMRTLALAVVKQPFRLQGEDVKFLRKYLNMTQAEFAGLLDIHKTNLSKWENNEDRIGEQSDRLIRAVVLALGDGLKEEMEEVVRSFPNIHKSKRRGCIDMDPESLSYSYA
jgi:putative zinc finger/helix-turn-helix YgiT family protein